MCLSAVHKVAPRPRPRPSVAKTIVTDSLGQTMYGCTQVH